MPVMYDGKYAGEIKMLECKKKKRKKRVTTPNTVRVTESSPVKGPIVVSIDVMQSA